MNIEEQFNQAVAKVKQTPPSKNTTPETQLVMYGLFKQANEGDVKGKAPLLNPVAKAKFKAWAANKGMDQEDAKQAYVAKVDELLKQA